MTRHAAAADESGWSKYHLGGKLNVNNLKGRPDITGNNKAAAISVSNLQRKTCRKTITQYNKHGMTQSPHWAIPGPVLEAISC